MYAVLVSVDIEPERLEEARAELTSRVVPMVKQSPGFVAGYWMAPERWEATGPLKGWSVVLVDSQQAADSLAEMARTGPTPPSVTVTQVTTREVVASA